MQKIRISILITLMAFFLKPRLAFAFKAVSESMAQIPPTPFYESPLFIAIAIFTVFILLLIAFLRLRKKS